VTRRRLHAEPRQIWSAEEDALLRRTYADTSAPAIRVQLPGHSVASIYNRARTLGLSKSAAFLASPASGRTDGRRGVGSRFQPGNTPWTKGRPHRPGGGSVLHQFRKGHMPHNHVPVGTWRQTTKGRQWREKVAEPGVWRFVHRMVWEAAHGPVPRGSVLAFRDGNTSHWELENLELIDRQAMMQRNTVHNLPDPLPQLIQLRGALVRKLHARTTSKEQGCEE